MDMRPSVLKNERGQAMVLTGVGFIAFIAMTAVAVDVAHLSHVSNDVQNLADIAATAGAQAVLNGDSAVSGTLPVVQQNSVDGAQPIVVSGSSCDPAGAPCAALQSGNYSAGMFTAGGNPANAVQANAFAKAQNIIGSLPDPLAAFTSNSTVQKTATATFVSVGSGQPGLPLAIGQSDFSGQCQGPGCTLPSLTQAPAGTNNSGWTAFSTGSPSKAKIDALLPAGGGCGGGGAAAPTLAVASGGTCPAGATCSINANGGQISTLLKDIQCLFDAGIWTYNVTQFLVPIIDGSGNLNGTYSVVGFATVVISSVTANGPNQGLNLQAVFNAGAPGAPGGGAFGTGYVVLVG